MAQRFGGKYSPNSPKPAPGVKPAHQRADLPHSFDGKAPRRAGARINMLFFAALLMLVPAFTGGPDALLAGIGSSALLILAAWLTREGMRAHQEYDARRIARRPAFPRKLAGSLVTGAGIALGASISQPGLFPLGFGILGALLHAFSFGPDPLRDKGAEGIDTFQTDRVARAVDEAEKLLAAMSDAILRAGDRALEARVDRFATTARAMFRTIEGDPRDLTAARKYLSVYLTGARDATVKFADLYRQNRDATARADYEALLDDLETNFASRTQTLLTDNRTDLDVEISVLRERLQREH
ncbi:5-bromo-4-chloroindolyl phosphate hydrolysis family protein [Tabrizicola sp. M-4]|uniref:5-bromo-4-chloroindolyl phosphate hydrolysis family protein n=1 Tax=Tabrizicola sp. M-4 TaxID=3055847 RepID=UPI003DA7F8E5